MQIRDLLPTDQSLLEEAFGPAGPLAEDDWGLVAEDADSTVGVLRVRRTTADDPGEAFLSADIPELTLHVFTGATAVADELLGEALTIAQRLALPGLCAAVDFGGAFAHAYAKHGFRTVGISDGADLMLRPFDD